MSRGKLSEVYLSEAVIGRTMDWASPARAWLWAATAWDTSSTFPAVLNTNQG